MNSNGQLIREIPEHDRPRERLERLGAGMLTDAELLAVLLRTGCRGISALQLGESLLKRFGGLEELGRSTVAEMAAVNGMGRGKATLLKAAFALHERVSSRAVQEAPLDQPLSVYRLMSERVRYSSVEILFGLALDSKLKLIRCYEISSGLLNQTLIHSREVFREAIAASASRLVLVHNHPSGDPRPSSDDVRSTREMVQAGKILGIPVLDHVIIGKPSEAYPEGFVSLKQAGIISEAS